jgi:hypothetical protein
MSSMAKETKQAKVKKPKQTKIKVDAQPVEVVPPDEWDPSAYNPGTVVRITAYGNRLDTKEGKILAIGCNRIPFKFIKASGGTVTKTEGVHREDEDGYSTTCEWKATATVILDSLGNLVLPGIEKQGYLGWPPEEIEDHAETVEVMHKAPPVVMRTMHLRPGMYVCQNKAHDHIWFLHEGGFWVRVSSGYGYPWQRTVSPDCQLQWAGSPTGFLLNKVPEAWPRRLEVTLPQEASTMLHDITSEKRGALAW